MIHFAQPLWLLVGVALGAFLVWLFARTDRLQRRALAEFANTRSDLLARLTASVSPQRRFLKRACLVAGTFLVCTALARPLAGYRLEETQQKSVDILFAVDTSKSMLTPDVKPDRLTRAKLAVEDLATKLDGDRLGLIAFAGEAFLQCPLTLDADAFRQSLEALDTQTIPKGGTDIASAIEAAREALHSEPSQVKILVLLSDGEDLDGGALEAAKAAAKDGLKIYTVGVGTSGGELIPVPGENGGTDFVRDDAGRPVKSRLDEGMLRRIAQATGGSYQPLGPRAEGLSAIYQTGLAALPHEQNATRMERVPLERFEWPLGLGLLLLLAEPLLGTRRREKPRPPEPNAPPLVHVRRGPRTVPAAGAPLALATLAALALAATAHASPASAQKAFDQGDYPRAEQEYGQDADRDKQNKKPELQFDYGAAAYKNKNFAPAAGAFQKALQTEQLPLQEGAYYNFGNTLYRLGQQTQQSDPKKTTQVWQQAVASYEAALRLNPKDADAAFNRDLVKKKIEQHEKEQKDQKNQQQNQQNQDKQDQNQSQQDQQNQQNQSTSPQDNSQQNPSGNQNPKPDQQKPDQSKPGDQNNSQGQQNKPPQPSDKEGQQNQNAQNKSGQDKPTDKGDKEGKGDKGDKDKDKNAASGQNAQGNQGQDKGDKEAAEANAPGKMTKEEAKSLLDAERGEERKLPLSSKDGKTAGESQTTEKDW